MIKSGVFLKWRSLESERSFAERIEFINMHENRNFCQDGMTVYDLGYLLLGWISSIKYDSREKS